MNDESAAMKESATSPMPSPEHPDYMMRPERAEKLLNLVRRKKWDDLTLSRRPKLLAVLKRKLLNQLRVPTASNPTFHLYREVDLMTAQAAKSVFFDLKKSGPFLRGKSVYLNFETDSNEVLRKWFALENMRNNGFGQGMMRSHGSVLVMARPPLLVEHQQHDEAEGIKMTSGMMTLSCTGVPRFAPPPPPEEDTPEAAQLRVEMADRDLEEAWLLVREIAHRETCPLDRRWYFSLAEKFGREYLSYLSDQEGMDSEVEEVNSSDDQDDM